jgi:hypothetical protein
MSLFGDIAKVASSVVNTVENVAGDAANLGGDLLSGGLNVAGGLAQVGGDLASALPLPLPFDPSQVLKGVEGLAGNLLGGLGGLAGGFPGLGDIGNIFGGNPPIGGSNGGTSGTGSTGGTSGTGDAFNSDVIGGSSIVAILQELANKERDSLYSKVDKLKNLKVPGSDATPQEQDDYDKQKTELTSEIQQLQNSIQQLTTMATNVQKTDNDTDMSIIRNFAS